MRRARWKRKNASAGRSAQAQTSCRRRGKVGASSRQSETETCHPWGNFWLGEIRDTSCAAFRCRWLSRAGVGETDRCRHRPLRGRGRLLALCGTSHHDRSGSAQQLRSRWRLCRLQMQRAPCGQAERAEGGTSGTLVTEILGAPQRETVKEELVKCVLAPRRGRHHPPRDGSSKSCGRV